MKLIIIILIATFLSSCIVPAQYRAEYIRRDVFIDLEIMPKPMGFNIDSLQNQLKFEVNQLIDISSNCSIEKFISFDLYFIVERDGSITYYSVQLVEDKDNSEEDLSLCINYYLEFGQNFINEMQKWEPGKFKRRNVAVLTSLSLAGPAGESVER